MKTVIYTYVNRKPKFFTLDRFYVIKNKKQYNQLIETLLDIDAVSSPHDPNTDTVSYPIVLELSSGFAPNLSEVSKKTVKKEAKKLQKIINKIV